MLAVFCLVAQPAPHNNTLAKTRDKGTEWVEREVVRVAIANLYDPNRCNAPLVDVIESAR